MRKLLIATVAVAATAALPASAGAASGPPSVEACDYIRNTICHFLPPTSVEDVCGIVEATTAHSCTVSSARTV